VWAHTVGLLVRSTENPAKRCVTRENGVRFQPTDEVALLVPKERRK
jgi:hypothetical protein